MNTDHLFSLCEREAWDEVRNYLLVSDASKKEEKKQQVSYQDTSSLRFTCLHLACLHISPDDIIKSLIDIGGKPLVMAVNGQKMTALHYSAVACSKHGASFNVMKMLIDVGGTDLVMAEKNDGNTGLHLLCYNINKQDSPADKIKLFLEAATDDTEEILRAKNNDGKTPLQIATERNASHEIKKLLRPGQPSSPAVLNDGKATPTESSNIQKCQVIPSKQRTASLTTWTPLPIEDSSTVSSSLDYFCNLQEQLEESNDRVRKIQNDFDEKCAHNSNLLQAETTMKLQFDIALLQKDEQLENLKSEVAAMKLQFEGALLQKDEQLENLQSEITALQQHAISFEHKNRYPHEMEDDANNANQSAGVKRKRCNDEEGNDEEHAITSDDIEGSAGDRNAKTVVGLYLLERKLHSNERERHGKVLTQLVETRRELEIVRSQLQNNTSADTTLSSASSEMNHSADSNN